MQEFYDLEKDEKAKYFGMGEWVNEPDTVVFHHNGIECKIIRVLVFEINGEAFGGHLCGYCSLPKGHPWENKGIFEIEAEVHGGITFSEENIESKDWIIGFDCAHAGDITPSILKMKKDILFEDNFPDEVKEMISKLKNSMMRSIFNPTYKNIVYAIQECKSLADQIVEATKCAT